MNWKGLLSKNLAQLHYSYKTQKCPVIVLCNLQILIFCISLTKDFNNCNILFYEAIEVDFLSQKKKEKKKSERIWCISCSYEYLAHNLIDL